ncbi:hypothetical protein LDENG_00234120 [Lucifuga dentata]|nr:hypothetical protein LDENG_00234120 [Lucifuga dentata]
MQNGWYGPLSCGFKLSLDLQAEKLSCYRCCNLCVCVCVCLHSKNPPQNIYSLYNQVGINCFIAAAIYVAVGAVSLCQVRLNKRQEYMVT